MVRIIPGFPGYLASDSGVVYGKRHGRPLKADISTKNYHRVTLYNGTNKKRVMVHRLVWELFVGPIHDELCINHIDGDKSNNRLDNLELTTNAENYRHSILTGLRKSKITQERADKIREIYFQGNTTQESLAQWFGIDQTQVSNIVLNKQWRHTNGKYT